MQFIKTTTVLFLLIAMSGCAMDPTKGDTAKQHLTGTTMPGTYSTYGKGVQKEDESGLFYIDVFVGGGGDRNGSQAFATTKIREYMKQNGLTSYEVVKSSYTFFPLSKYRIYVQYK